MITVCLQIVTLL